MIRLGTLFSGIGAIEQALNLMNVNHENVFACDNGELELKILPLSEQKEYDELKKIPRYRITQDEVQRLSELTKEEREIIDSYALKVRNLQSIAEKRKFVDELYDNYSKGVNLVKQTYLANYAIHEDDFHLDVHFLDGRDYENRVDLMVGGSPCQSFSSNGKRGGFADTRGTLFHDYARIISEVRPKAFIFENVKGMINHDKGNTWRVIKQTFEEDCGYDVYYQVLNGRDYGIPQSRERIYCIGFKHETEFKYPAPIKLENTVYDFLEEIFDTKYLLKERGVHFVTETVNHQKSYTQINGDVMLCQKRNQLS